MRGIFGCTAIVAAMLLAGAAPAQTNKRLTIVNECKSDAWAVFTPGGTPQQPAVQANSGAWFRPVATVENFVNTGWLGTVAISSKTVTLSSPGKVPPKFVFVRGQIILIAGAGKAGAELTTTVVKVSNENTVLQVDRAALTAVVKAALSYDTLTGAILINGNGGSKTFAVPDKGAPGSNFRFYIGCPSLTDDKNPFTGRGCVIGAASGDLAAINTLFEPTFGCVPGTGRCAFNPAADPTKYPKCSTDPNAANCPPLGPTDFYDISAVDGYTLPMKVTATGKGCSAPVKDASMLDLGSCPTENKTTLFSTEAKQQALIERGIRLLTGNATYQKACVAPFHWFELGTVGSPVDTKPTQPACAAGACSSVSYYAGAGCDTASPRLACPGGSGPQQRVGPKQDGTFAIQNTNWVKDLYALGYTGYSWQYGDGVGQQTCPATAQARYTVTLCPNGGEPYKKTAAWQFFKATGSCSLATGAGKTYPSLAACQQANMRYTCDDLTAGDPFKVPGALWRADPAATRAGKGTPYTQMKAVTKCFNFKINGIAGVPNVPICVEYYGNKTTPPTLCPSASPP